MTDPRAFGDHQHSLGTQLVHTDAEVIVVGHAAAREIALDPASYSSGVSAHLQLPNGLDGEEHARFRTLLDIYLNAEVVAEMDFRSVARDVLDRAADSLDADRLAALFSVRAMRHWLSWPESLEDRLLDWVAENARAARSGDRAWTARVAAEYDEIITAALEATPEGSVTWHLAHDHGLEHAEIVSILRNWTAGDLGSMAKCIGVIVRALADNVPLQERLRGGVSHMEFVAIADELLRLDDPFVSNRRVTTCPVHVAGEELDAGTRVRLHWTAANRDPHTFRGFDPEGHAADNLVWGVGAHYCPGKPLSMYEFHAFFAELLPRFDLVPSGDGERDLAGGWARTPVVLRAR